MAAIVENVKRKQASVNTMYHALYGHYYLGLSRTKLASIYGKRIGTISNWISKYESDRILHGRKAVKRVFKKFGAQKRAWLVNLYLEHPLLHLDEAKTEFLRKFGISISPSSVSVILHEAGMSYQVVERRARQMQINDVLRFCTEMSDLKWSWDQLVFLDEVSLNGQDMLRKRGFGIKGKKIIYRGEFSRTKRTSLLCFIGVEGLLNAYETEGTFCRKIFVDDCAAFAESGVVYKYPGPHSIWLLDGARIHCSSDFVYFLRALGILPIFLPAYCPYFNPIEFMFAVMKKELKKRYIENSKADQKLLLCQVLQSFTQRDMSSLFEKCGYTACGYFDPSKGLGEDLMKFGFS